MGWKWKTSSFGLKSAATKQPLNATISGIFLTHNAVKPTAEATPVKSRVEPEKTQKIRWERSE